MDTAVEVVQNDVDVNPGEQIAVTDRLDEAIKAAEAAAKEGEEAEAGPKEEPKAKPKAKADGELPSAKDTDDPEDLRRILQTREKAKTIELQAKERANEIDRKAQERERQLDERARAMEADHGKMQEHLKWLEGLRGDPEKAFAVAGWKPDEVLLNLAKGTAPEAQLERAFKAQGEQLRAMQEEIMRERQERTRVAEEQKRQKDTQEKQETYNRVITLGMDEDKHPRASSFYKGDEDMLFAHADKIATRCNAKGVPWTLETLVAAVEVELRERGVGVPAKTNGNGTNGAAKKARPVTRESASEKRSAPVRGSHESDDERLTRAIQAAEAAAREAGEDL